AFIFYYARPLRSLSRRDALPILNQLAGVRVIEQDGSFNITIGNGQVLLGGDTVFPLQAIPSADDPTRIVVAYSAPVGAGRTTLRSEEHTSELQSREKLVCRLLLE